jgi:tetratricopeptide (TPR) repeat protein
VSHPTTARQDFWVWVSLVLFLVCLVFLQPTLDRVSRVDPQKELLFIPHQKVLHAFALGEDGLAADLLWLRCVFYIAANSVEEKQEEFHKDLRKKASPAVTGGQTKDFKELDFRTDPRVHSLFFWNMNSTEAPQLFRLAETITDLDPHFVTPYIHTSMNLALYYGRYDEARSILDKCVRNNPGRWEPTYYRGFLRLFYENDKIGAAEDIRAAAMHKQAPTIVVQLAAALEYGSGRRDVALDFLRTLRELTDDATLKAKIDDMMYVYGSGIKRQRVNQKTEVDRLLDSALVSSSGGLLQ